MSTLSIACPDCAWREIGHPEPAPAWEALMGHKGREECHRYPHPADHTPPARLAAQVTALRLAVEQARRRLGMGLLGELCGRDRVRVAHAEVTRLLMRACAETHDLLADTRPLDGPALQRSA